MKVRVLCSMLYPIFFQEVAGVVQVSLSGEEGLTDFPGVTHVSCQQGKFLHVILPHQMGPLERTTYQTCDLEYLKHNQKRVGKKSYQK